MGCVSEILELLRQEFDVEREPDRLVGFQDPVLQKVQMKLKNRQIRQFVSAKLVRVSTRECMCICVLMRSCVYECLHV